MRPFELVKPDTLSQAINYLQTHPAAKMIAGGTNIIDLMKEDVEQPPMLIDLTQLPMADIVVASNGTLRIGALVRNSDLAYHPDVMAQWPLVSAALLAGASPQLRNMATTAGNLLQRTRCYYFYDTATVCNKRTPGQGCAALGGHNRIHAILGASDQCVATHPSDLCIALAALEAVVVAHGPLGERRVAFSDFHRLPDNRPELDTVLEPNEIITAVEIPPSHYAEHYDYLKLRDRRSYAFALVSVAAGLEISNGVIVSARIALGGVAHKPWRDSEAEQALVGKAPGDDTFTLAASILLRQARPLRDNAFKIELSQRAIVRALTRAVSSSQRSLPHELANRPIQ